MAVTSLFKRSNANAISKCFSDSEKNSFKNHVARLKYKVTTSKQNKMTGGNKSDSSFSLTRNDLIPHFGHSEFATYVPKLQRLTASGIVVSVTTPTPPCDSCYIQNVFNLPIRDRRSNRIAIQCSVRDQHQKPSV